jgi:cell division protein ZipA
METSLRLGLLVLGFVMVLGIIWDIRRKPAVRHQKKSKIQSKRSGSGELDEVIILHVMAKPSHVFLGSKLQQLFSTFNIVYGEMQIFHYFDITLNGTGEPIFSVASAIEPGTFEIDKMDTFVTPGLSLFLRVRNTQDPRAAFECMLKMAEHLVAELEGELQDERHQRLNPQGIAQYRDSLQNNLNSISFATVRAT